MVLRRDTLLNELGVIQWVLRRPSALRGDVAVVLPVETRLLLISPLSISLDTPVLRDVLRTLQLTIQQVYCITPEQLNLLPVHDSLLVWYLGVEPVPKREDICILTPALDHFSHSSDAKRALWQQICQHETDIFPNISRFSHGLGN